MKLIQQFEVNSEYLPEQYSFIHVADNFCFEGDFYWMALMPPEECLHSAYWGQILNLQTLWAAPKSKFSRLALWSYFQKH